MSDQPGYEPSVPVHTQTSQHDLDTRSGNGFERYQRRKADNTIRRHKADLTLFEIYLAEGGQSVSQLISHPTAWHDITAELVEMFVEWQIEKGYAIETINIRLSTVKRYAGLAYRAGGISSEELLRIREIKGFRRAEGRRIDAKRPITRVGDKKAAPTLLSPEQLAALFQVPNLSTPQGWRDLFLLRLLYDLGLRPGEIITMVLEDLDLQRETIHVQRHKTDGEQYLRLTPDLLSTATHYVELRQDSHTTSPLIVGTRRSRQLVELVIGRDGMRSTPPISQQSLFRRIHALGKLIGVNINAYDARHQWTKDALDAGNPLVDVLDAGGWAKDSPMARRYVGERAIANERIQLKR